MKISDQDIEWVRSREDRCLTLEGGSIHRGTVNNSDWSDIVLWAQTNAPWASTNTEVAEWLLDEIRSHE